MTTAVAYECPCQPTGKPKVCPRHRVRKSAQLQVLCRQRGKYWQAWETGRGPGQKPLEPTAPVKAARYGKAVAKHVLSGGRKRSLEEIVRIYETVCRLCERYNAQTGGCRVCGCRVNRNRNALRNKIAMASQHCPKGKW